MHLTSEEFNKLIYIASGTFGSVYHDKNMAYKKYHEYIKENHDFGYNITYNPCLKQSMIRLKLMKYRSNLLIYNQFFTDILYIDNKFCGVCYPLLLGNTLNELDNLTYNTYYDISKQLIRNAKELTDHNIYPLDYKQNNIIYTTKGEVKIIDLDDKLTKYTLIKNPILLNKSIKILNRTIVNFVNKNYEGLSKDILINFENYNDAIKNNSYEKVYEYIERLIIPKNFLLLNEENSSQSALIKKLMIENKVIPVLLVNYKDVLNKKVLLSIINQYQNSGINLYDIVYDNINDFILKTNTNDILYLENDKVLSYKYK